MTETHIEIDRDKLRTLFRQIGNPLLFFILYEAIDLLPPADLNRLIGKYIDLRHIQSDRDQPPGLLEEVRIFSSRSRAGEYYESFSVDSRNYTSLSLGTTAWIAEFNRLLDRCVELEQRRDSIGVLPAFDILFGLLDHIDEGQDDILFFADEGGAWVVGVDWNKVLPSWFRVLSAAATPEEYAQRIIRMVDHHCRYCREELVSLACKAATAEQRQVFTRLFP